MGAEHISPTFTSLSSTFSQEEATDTAFVALDLQQCALMPPPALAQLEGRSRRLPVDVPAALVKLAAGPSEYRRINRLLVMQSSFLRDTTSSL